MLNRIQKRWCNEQCLAGCIEVEKKLTEDLRELLGMSGCEFSIKRDDDGILVGAESRTLADTFLVVYVKNQVRVEHRRIVKQSNEQFVDEHVFRSVSEVISYLAKNIPMD